jgi:hypothetical protein
MHLLRKSLMLLLVVAVLGALWLVAADHAESSRPPLTLTSDGTLRHFDSVATNDSKPITYNSTTVVGVLKSLVTG